MDQVLGFVQFRVKLHFPFLQRLLLYYQFQHQLEKMMCLLEMEKMAVVTVARMLDEALGLQKSL
jgi:hypothetical protein